MHGSLLATSQTSLKRQSLDISKRDKTPTNPINYRPIALLEVPGKIFERLIQSRLKTFLNDNNILKERQHGF